jgi:hypothetical protein
MFLIVSSTGRPAAGVDLSVNRLHTTSSEAAMLLVVR